MCVMFCIHTDVTSLDGTAMAGVDYTAVSKNLMFVGQSNMVAVTVNISSDSTEGDSLRCFYLTLSNPSPSAGIGPQTKICIVEDDGKESYIFNTG